jgi:rhamnogalacturonyl hydrolase YesR
LDYLIRNQKDSPPGYLYVQSGSGFGAMYSHGFGTLFLAEAYGMVSDKKQQKRVRDALQRAVDLILKAQNKVQGGWRYDTDGSSADVSVTICQIMALRSARNAGIKVPKSAVDRCVEYVKKCQNDDGGFNYMLGNRNGSMFPRSAAGLCALYCAGIYEGREVDRALDYLMRFKPSGRQQGGFGGRGAMGELHYFYGHYYAAQAMWTAGGKYWQEWFPAIREELLARSRNSGAGVWADNAVCTDYGTAMACIVLQIPNNYLPIMQK